MSLQRLIRAGWCGASLLAAASCGDSGPVAPLVSPRTEAAQANGGITMGSIVKWTEVRHENVVVSKRMTTRGGSLKVPNAGLELWFPENALSRDLTITVTVLRGHRVIYAFEPHGITFNVPVYVFQTLKGTELNVPRGVVRPDVWAGYLEDINSDVADDGTGTFSEVFPARYEGHGKDYYAVFSTTHFSGYAMASGRQSSSDR
jgi:hypothetical protein